MTREQQIKAALEILKLPPGRRAAARVSIEKALDALDCACVLHWKMKFLRSKTATKARDAHYRALCRLRVTHKSLFATARGIGLDLTTIENAITAFEELDALVRYEFYPDFDGRWRQGFTVAAGHALLMQYWGSDEFITKTRKGAWWRLSAILYGDENADLFRHMCAFKPERGPFRLERTRTG
jgi:hypothetical protein